MVAPSEVASITITRSTASLVAQAFNSLMIAGYHTVFAGRQKAYTDPTTFHTDFPSGAGNVGAIRLAGDAFWAATPRPDTLQIGRLSAQPSKVFVIVPTAVDSLTYKMNVNGTAVSFTAGVGTTITLITAGLKTAIDALAIAGLTTASGGVNLTLTGTAWYSVDISSGTSDGQMTIQETTADVIGAGSISVELDAIKAAGDTFFGVVCIDHSAAINDGVGDWVLANNKMAIASTQDSDVGTNSTTDVASAMQTDTNTNITVFWHHQPQTFPEVSLFCQMFTQIPGRRASYFKALNGIPSSSAFLTATMIQNFKAKNVTWYDTLYGLNRTFGGKVASGEWFDIIFGSYYYQARLSTEIWRVDANEPDKTDYDNTGILKMVGAIQLVMEEMIDNHYLRKNLVSWPTLGYQLSYPDVSTVIAADLTSRTLNNVSAVGSIAGGIYKTSFSLSLVP